MDGTEPKIEIFKPFGEAFELMKKILFQPFDLGKWCVIGFAAFLTYLSGGGFTGFRFPGSGNWVNHVSNVAPNRENIRSFIDQLGPVWLSLIAVGILVLIAIAVVLTWVRARGHFVFIDCIVRNRAAIMQPWNEFKEEGNSYFVFSLIFLLTILVLFIAVTLIVVLTMLFLGRQHHSGVMFLPLLALLVLLPVMFVIGTLLQFVAPVMYRRRVKAWAAFTELWSLLGQHLGVFILYFLFSIVIGIAIAIIVVMATCLTCCIAAIPYVGTVILLPVYVLMQSFSLLFLRQFGPDYDVWAGILQAAPAVESSSLPPPIPPVPPLIQS